MQCDWRVVERGVCVGRAYAIFVCEVCGRETATVRGQRVRAEQFGCVFDVKRENQNG